MNLPQEDNILTEIFGSILAAQAAITKYQNLGDLNYINLFSLSSWSEKVWDQSTGWLDHA